MGLVVSMAMLALALVLGSFLSLDLRGAGVAAGIYAAITALISALIFGKAIIWMAVILSMKSTKRLLKKSWLIIIKNEFQSA